MKLTKVQRRNFFIKLWAFFTVLGTSTFFLLGAYGVFRTLVSNMAISLIMAVILSGVNWLSDDAFYLMIKNDLKNFGDE